MHIINILLLFLWFGTEHLTISSRLISMAALSIEVPHGSILGPLIFNIFLNDIFYFATESDLYNYADDNCVSVSHTEMNILSSYLQSETQSMVKWFTDNSMRANAGKFQGIILCGGREQKTININVGESDICVVSKIEVLGVSIDDKLNCDDHVKRICSKASAQIYSALQHLTGLIDLPSRKAIYSSFIAANFNYCPLVCFLPAEKYWYDWKNPRTGTQICSPGPSIQLWCPFGKSLLWILQNSRRKIVTCWNVQDF